MIDQVLTNLLAAADKGTDGGQCLAKGPHQEIDVPKDTLFFRLSQPLSAIESHCMGLIQVEHGSKLFFQFHQPPQISHISIHTED